MLASTSGYAGGTITITTQLVPQRCPRGHSVAVIRPYHLQKFAPAKHKVLVLFKANLIRTHAQNHK